MNMSFPTHSEIEIQPISKVIDFARESYSDELVNEMIPLWNAHYKEIALYKDIKLSPDLKVYQASDKLGFLRIFTARYEGKLIGYEILFIHPHPHYSEAMTANQDILFLTSELRQGLTGYRFIKWCDAQLAQEGIHIVFQHVKVSHDFGPLLERLGYVKHDIVYSRRLI